VTGGRHDEPPSRAADERVQKTFVPDDKASFVKSVGSLRSDGEAHRHSEGNGEGPGGLTLFNDGATAGIFEVTSFYELVLGSDPLRTTRIRPSRKVRETEIAQ